jgi:hypothetical protein
MVGKDGTVMEGRKKNGEALKLGNYIGYCGSNKRLQ